MLTMLIARNIILFSLIIDEASSTSIWNIFYHLYIPDTDTSLLRAQADKLLLLSDSISNWRCSVYGKTIRFLDQHTLHCLRKIWAKYAATAALTTDARKQPEALIREAIKKISNKSPAKVMHVHGLAQ
jgi:hypothetical protein